MKTIKKIYLKTTGDSLVMTPMTALNVSSFCPKLKTYLYIWNHFGRWCQILLEIACRKWALSKRINYRALLVLHGRRSNSSWTAKEWPDIILPSRQTNGVTNARDIGKIKDGSKSSLKTVPYKKTLPPCPHIIFYSSISSFPRSVELV